jgi:hypothetical protein
MIISESESESEDLLCELEALIGVCDSARLKIEY